MDRLSFILYDSNMGGVAAGRTIKTYNLFGEVSDLPDVVHCETIAARSILNEWEFAPHRHARLHQILLIERGGGRATMEGKVHPLGPMRVVNVPAGHVHGFSFRRGTQGFVLTIAAEMLDQVLIPSEGLRGALSTAAVLSATPQMVATVAQIFAEHAARGFARAHLLRSWSAALLGLVARHLAASGRPPDRGASAGLYERFEALLERHFLQHWSVSDYAAALAITPTHLSRVTRSATGHPASRIIADRLIREARRNLVYTSLPVSTIAYSLGFKDPAYFSRLFSAAIGQSPRSFRRKVQR